MPRIITGTTSFEVFSGESFKHWVMTPNEEDADLVLLWEGYNFAGTMPMLDLSWVTGRYSAMGNSITAVIRSDRVWQAGISYISHYITGINYSCAPNSSGMLCGQIGVSDTWNHCTAKVLWVTSVERDYGDQIYGYRNGSQYQGIGTGTYRSILTILTNPESLILGIACCSGTSPTQEIIYESGQIDLYTGISPYGSSVGEVATFRFFTQLPTPTGVNNVDLVNAYLKKPTPTIGALLAMSYGIAYREVSQYKVQSNF
jgi:hypothetical protein